MFFYSKTSQPTQIKVNVWEMDGTAAYLRHYDNYLFLDFVSKNPLAKDSERQQARLELTICEEKLAWWRRHPNYDHELTLKGVEALKRNWRAAA